MYAIDWVFLLNRKARISQENVAGAGTGRASAKSALRPVVSRTVWALGVTSLLTDISSEMVGSILPVYLVLHLGLSPLAFGVVDGIYQGAAALVRVVSGVLSDRWRRHKEMAATGYALSAACRVLILAAGTAWSTIAAVVAVDRLGKGIRTAPRDALISQRTPKESLASAFGVHRSMDAAGAMFGPILAFGLLAAMPGGFDVLFVTSFGIAVLGVGAIALFVPARLEEDRTVGTRSVSLRSTAALLAESRFRALVLSGFSLGIATISDSFIFLILQRRLDLGATAFPLLYVGTSLFTSLLAIPCGRLADRIGRRRVMLGGYVVLAGLYALLAGVPSGGLALAGLTLALLGMYYAATEGVLTAMAAAVLPESHSGAGLAVLATATNVARLVASVGFGWLWTVAGLESATAMGFVALTAAIIASAVTLKSAERDGI
ncbi:MAG: MFS transporter [Vicinamibacterales bacterium]